VAVIPFADLSPGQDQEFFSDGLAEEILNALAQLEGLKVAGRTSSFAFRDKAGDLKAIGRKLGVAAVLEGSVRVDGGRVRVTAQLVKTADGYHLWSQTFDRELRGVFAVQDEIATAVVEALKVKLLAGRAPTSREFRTANPEVYSLYLQARRLQRRDTVADSERAEGVSRKALALDPGYAPAWALLAHSVFWSRGNAGPTEEAIRAGQAEAMAAAEKAVALAPDLPDGYAARAFLRVSGERAWEGAVADMERAIALSPGDPDPLWRYARSMLGPLGRLDQAIALARRASELDPLSPAPWAVLSTLHLANGQAALARSSALRSLELQPVQDSAPVYLASVELVEGHPAAALQAIKASPDPIFHRQIEAVARWDLGDRKGSQAALDEMVAGHAHDAPFQIACVHAWRGEADLAFRWLDRALVLNDGGLADLRLEPLLGKIRGDPRMAELERRVGLPPR
jgi:TolB-like protein/Tfp pilus assembly protein PilF